MDDDMNAEELMEKTVGQIAKISKASASSKSKKVKVLQFHIYIGLGSLEEEMSLSSMLYENASKNIKCGYIAVGRSEIDIGAWLLSIAAKVNILKIQTGFLSVNDVEKLQAGVDKILELPIEIVSVKENDISSIQDEIQRLKNEENCEMVFTDRFKNLDKKV